MRTDMNVPENKINDLQRRVFNLQTQKHFFFRIVDEKLLERIFFVEL